MERSSFTRKFIGNGEISRLNQLITAVTRNCCFSVSCSHFFPIFVCGNGEISVAKPQLRVAAKRWRQLRARSLINSLKICRKKLVFKWKKLKLFFRQALQKRFAENVFSKRRR